jgi:hypothetical protein
MLRVARKWPVSRLAMTLRDLPLIPLLLYRRVMRELAYVKCRWPLKITLSLWPFTFASADVPSCPFAMLSVIEKATEMTTIKPITMQDVRLVAGEGPLSATTVLDAINVILKQRSRRVS